MQQEVGTSPDVHPRSSPASSRSPSERVTAVPEWVSLGHRGEVHEMTGLPRGADLCAALSSLTEACKECRLYGARISARCDKVISTSLRRNLCAIRSRATPNWQLGSPSNQETTWSFKPLRSCHSWWVGDYGNRSATRKVWIAEGQLPVPRGLELCAIEELGADKIGAGKVGGIED